MNHRFINVFLLIFLHLCLSCQADVGKKTGIKYKEIINTLTKVTNPEIYTSSNNVEHKFIKMSVTKNETNVSTDKLKFYIWDENRIYHEINVKSTIFNLPIIDNLINNDTIYFGVNYEHKGKVTFSFIKNIAPFPTLDAIYQKIKQK